MSTADTGLLSGVLSTAEESVINISPSQIEPELKARLKKDLGLNDDQLTAWLAMADPDDPNNSLSPIHFSTANKETLDALAQSDDLSPLAQELVSARAPIAMATEVSNPANWQKDQYIGPGAMAVNAFIQPSPMRLPVDDLIPPIDPNTISIDALVMSVLTQRAEIIEVQLRDQISSIQQKNSELEIANDWLTQAKSGKAATDDEAGTRGNFSNEMKAYWDSLGAIYQSPAQGPHNGGLLYKSADWDVAIEGLKAKIEALTSQSQLETTKLQQTINKYNQSFEMLSNFINKYYQSINAIIQNLR